MFRKFGICVKLYIEFYRLCNLCFRVDEDVQHRNRGYIVEIDFMWGHVMTDNSPGQSKLNILRYSFLYYRPRAYFVGCLLTLSELI